MNLWYNLAMLTAESQQVVALRMWKLASGGADAPAEMHLMVSEKLTAAAQTATRVAAGASPDSIVLAYRKKVQANARRLMKF